jgi:triphosphoribosyl-dephospho-CoA synthetase
VREGWPERVRWTLREFRARCWWRRQLHGPLRGRVSEQDRETIEARFTYAHPDFEQAYIAAKLRREIRGEEPGVATRILRTFAAALRDGESIENALLAATLKLVQERGSGLPADRDELMEAFRKAALEEARRLRLDDPDA